MFTKHGGSLGSVMWNFDKKGVVRINKEEASKAGLNKEEAELELIDQGAEDIKKEEEGTTIYTSLSNLDKMKRYFDSQDATTESADIEYVARDIQEVSAEDKEKIEKFMEALEESDDVSDYYTNVDI